jgi:hypothetical protein
MEPDRFGLPSPAGLLTIARGRRRELQARHDALAFLRSQRETALPFLDENAAKAVQAAQNARVEIGLIDGQLIVIEAALAEKAA